MDDYDGYDGVGVTCSIEDYPPHPRYFAYAKSHSICLLMYALLVLHLEWMMVWVHVSRPVYYRCIQEEDIFAHHELYQWNGLDLYRRPYETRC